MNERRYYDLLFTDAPEVAPFGADSAEWLAAYLGKFDATRIKEVADVAKNTPYGALREPKALYDFLRLIWDAVSRELDCSELPQAEQQALGRIEQKLAYSVHVLRAGIINK
jgi:hypothetical protein